MNWEQIEGKWDQVKGKAKEKWGQLTDKDLTIIQGKKDQLVGKLRERYGYDKERTAEELDSFLKDCNCDTEARSSKIDSCSG